MSENINKHFDSHNHVRHYVISVVMKGTVAFCLENREVACCKGDVFIIPPYAVHSVRLGRDARLLSMCMGTVFIEEIDLETTEGIVQELSGDAVRQGIFGKEQRENKNGWHLTAILNTHSNADHIGGNRYLQGQTGCKVYSSGIEAAYTKYPVLEPSFLYGGYPCKDLRHKFLMAQDSSVTGIELRIKRKRAHRPFFQFWRSVISISRLGVQIVEITWKMRNLEIRCD